ncbi:exonuclease SbcCD subunit D [Nocardioides terrisoli]|uniref:exonuclease SbcCD subunit D n=1 Tax=Nocardioides terrisoli TaxID=3388267 RepID=UPI00287B7D2A|nr:exonuclease SbcCD subunit D [Nocardioides marmorisolisilvae]
MRILHTSDWHLGRAFHGVGMLTHQAAWLDHLLEVVEQESVDLVVVAGDVYDRGLPPVDAVALANEALGRLAASRARVVVTSGNHDSARRLGFAAGLIDHAGVHLRTDAGDVGRPVLLEDAHGAVAVYGIPYLDPDLARRAWDLPTRSHHAALSAALQRVEADLATRPGTRSVLLAHAFVAGGAPSDSERDIAVGGISVVPTALFDRIDYTALGHLHGAQTLSESVRYSGSPLAYSFSEASHTKGSWLVELGATGCTAQFVAAPVPRPLARLNGSLETLLTDAALAVHEHSWVQATLTDTVRPLQAMDRLRARFPHALALSYSPADRPTAAVRGSSSGRSDHDLALEFLAAVRGTPADAAEAALLQRAVDSCCHDVEADTLTSVR